MDRAPIGLTQPDERRVIAELELELAPWVGAEGLQLTMEVNTAIGRR